VKYTLDFLYPSPLQFSSSIPAWAGLGDGVEAFKRQEFALALREFSVLADQGDADAQYFLGSLYQHGDGVAKNIDKAIPWLEKATHQNHFGATNAVAVIYAGENKKVRDYDKAARYFKLVAKQDVPEAMYNLGLMFMYGLGIEQSTPQAAQWFQQSAVHGIAAAQYKLGMLIKQGDSGEADPAKALEWYLKAAEQGYEPAEYEVGMLFHLGDGIPKDDELALHWLKLAAKHYVRPAQTQLAYFFDQGLGVSADHIKAFYWYSRAAELGEESAQYALGNKYNRGDGVPQDFVLAYVWFNLASAQGVAKAGLEREKLLERMTPLQLESGQEVSRDYFEKYVIKPNKVDDE